jgi:guanylate kinase
MRHAVTRPPSSLRTSTRDALQGLLCSAYGNPPPPHPTPSRACTPLLLSPCCPADVQGARAIRHAAIPALFVFIAPPSLDELELRLRGRGTETPQSMTRRIKNARQEIAR